MKLKQIDLDRYILRLDLGDEIYATITQLAKEHNIHLATVHGIGAVKELELGFYDLPTKNYLRKYFPDDMEILSLSGNITLKEGEPFVHLHGLFSDEEFHVVGGHFFQGTIAVAGEFFIHSGDLKIQRELNPKIGIWEIDC